MRFDILTLFPDMFPGYLGQSLLKRAIDAGLVEVCLHDIRNWTQDKHKKVDDRPYGGGPGMVMMVEPVVACVEAVRPMAEDPGHLVMLTPQGRPLNQAGIERLACHKRVLLLCGRYEGFDERVRTVLNPEEISIGDYVLNGGEVAAMVIVDAVIRLVPGVLGDAESSRTTRFPRPRGCWICPIHAASGVPRAASAGDFVERRPWRDRPMAGNRQPPADARRRADLLESSARPKEADSSDPHAGAGDAA